MQRKNFIGHLFALAGGTLFHASKSKAEMPNIEDHKGLVPPPLKPGDTIGILAPAGRIDEADLVAMIDTLKSWGYLVKIGKTIGARHFTFGGTDQERLNDLQSMMDDPDIRAIWSARGGYGLVRIVDKLNVSGIKKNPKWVIGFSDLTVLHLHLFEKIRLQTIHAKMSHAFSKDPSTLDSDQVASLDSIRKMLQGESNKYEIIPDSANRLGTSTGTLVGGNLAVIQSLIGSASELDTDNNILFLEDTGEYLYQLDRLLWSLKRAGKLDKLKGLIIGGFSVKKDDEGEEFALSLKEIILEKTKDSFFPICFGFPVGHQKANYALKCGAKYKLEVNPSGSILTEIDVHP